MKEHCNNCRALPIWKIFTFCLMVTLLIFTYHVWVYSSAINEQINLYKQEVQLLKNSLEINKNTVEFYQNCQGKNERVLSSTVLYYGQLVETKICSSDVNKTGDINTLTNGYKTKSTIIGEIPSIPVFEISIRTNVTGIIVNVSR